MKWLFLIIAFLNIVSCNQETKATAPIVKHTPITHDTVIIKQRKELNASYEVGFYSKSYAYHWLAGKDTLDFGIIANEYEKDSTLHLYILHNKPLLFSTALKRIKECLHLISEDFNLSKFSSIYFLPPIYYADLSRQWSKDYEQKFGRKQISYQKLNPFLLESTINLQLNSFLKPMNKKVNRYGIEKFHLMEKRSYSIDLPDTDFKDYPEFTIHGLGLSVQLTANR